MEYIHDVLISGPLVGGDGMNLARSESSIFGIPYNVANVILVLYGSARFN